MQMQVRRLQLKNFRGISDLTLEFDAGEPTVFVGVNGVGKSSILDCLAIMLSWLTARIQFDPKDLSLETKYLLKQGKILYHGRYFSKKNIKSNFQETSSQIIISLDSASDLTWTGRENQSSELPEFAIGKRGNPNLSSSGHDSEDTDEPATLESVTDKIRQKLKGNPEASIPLAVYYPVDRSVQDVNLKMPDNYKFQQVDAYENALDGVKINFTSFFKWFRALEDLEGEERRDNPNYEDKRLAAVRKSIYSVLGDEFQDLRVRRKSLEMTVKKRGEELIINQLSDGEKSLLAMTGDLARRLALANPSLEDPLQGSAVVLIDEIEQHLHPAWQRQIIPVLTKTFPNCQFIITTHSPQVLSQIKPDNIYILKKIEDNIVAQRPESSFGRDSNRILEDLMEVPERPQEIKQRLLELFRLIDQGNLESARELRQEIAEEIGEDEPELVKARVSIRRREILQK
ncbi:MAG: AAA family ATPase [Oscillatoriaceae cyanobacterium]